MAARLRELPSGPAFREVATESGCANSVNSDSHMDDSPHSPSPLGPTQGELLSPFLMAVLFVETSALTLGIILVTAVELEIHHITLLVTSLAQNMMFCGLLLEIKRDKRSIRHEKAVGWVSMTCGLAVGFVAPFVIGESSSIAISLALLFFLTALALARGGEE